MFQGCISGCGSRFSVYPGERQRRAGVMYGQTGACLRGGATGGGGGIFLPIKSIRNKSLLPNEFGGHRPCACMRDSITYGFFGMN